MENQVSLSLFEVNSYIKAVLKNMLYEDMWVKAEISEIHTNASGHCYMELIEKDKNNTIIARQRATIWSNNYKMLKAYFEQTTQMTLQAGLEIMVFCSVEMHENYGLSLNISDINPEFTIGKIASEKTKIILQLEQDGVIELNKQLPFPQLPKRIAMVSSKTAAGYEDFCHQIKNNSFGYKFCIKLFEATMQGNNTENSLIEAFDRIYQNIDSFDVIAIIRGGGATSDISAFNNYNIASHIAQFPIPVVVGIGHQRDETIADIVAYNSLKTPTAVADFIIEKVRIEENKIDDISENISKLVKFILDKNQQNIKEITYKISLYPKSTIQKEVNKIENITNLLKQDCKNLINSSNSQLETAFYTIKNHSKNRIKNSLEMISNKEKTLKLVSPENILKRGYTYIKQENRFIKSVKELNDKQSFDIIFKDGSFLVE